MRVTFNLFLRRCFGGGGCGVCGGLFCAPLSVLAEYRPITFGTTPIHQKADYRISVVVSVLFKLEPYVLWDFSMLFDG